MGRAVDRLGHAVGGEADQALELGALAVEAQLVGEPEDGRGPEPEPEAHADGEAPPGSEAPRDGGGGLERRLQLLTGTGARTPAGASAAETRSSGSSTSPMTGRKRTARPKAAMPIPTSMSVMIPSATVGA